MWVDHHQNTTFKTKDAQLDYETSRLNSNRTLIYDGKYPAGAKLLWDHLGAHSSDPARYAEMVRWATITDSAGYENCDQAVFGDQPALRIAQTLGTAIDPERLKAILQALRNGTIDEVAALPIVAKPFSLLRPRIEAGLDIISKHLKVSDDGMIASYETTVTSTDVLPRYGSFYLFPNIKYAVSLVHGDRGSKISASRNPWGPPTAARIGTIMETYGGGGHDEVGSYQLPLGNIDKSRTIFHQILLNLATAETTKD